MTLSELYDQIKYIGYQFNTWDIPLDEEVHLEVKEGENGYYIGVTVTKE